MLAQCLLQAREKARSQNGGPLRHAVPGHDVEHRTAHTAGQRVAAKGGAVLAGREQIGRLTPRQAGTDRKAVTQRLRQGHDVGCDARMLVPEPRAGAAHARLDFVDHQ